ncbi:MAG: AAA family ATPase [Vannielia sp.]
MAPCRIIVIHGAYGTGKSTLARAVQKALPAPFVDLTFDQPIESFL